MTRREFDRLTKRNWGAFDAAQWRTEPELLADFYRVRRGRRVSYMSASEREAYRISRAKPVTMPADRLALRAAEVARTRSYGLGRDGTLGRGSRYRAPAAWAASTGRPLLRLVSGYAAWAAFWP